MLDRVTNVRRRCEKEYLYLKTPSSHFLRTDLNNTKTEILQKAPAVKDSTVIGYLLIENISFVLISSK